jgi:hypothetical protein
VESSFRIWQEVVIGDIALWNKLTWLNDRICPGMYIAERMVLMFAASILSAYRILPVDEEVILSPIEFRDSLVR